MKITASADWRDGLEFDVPVVVASVSPGADARCFTCGGESAPLARTDLWAIKHRHPKQHDGYVRFYCSEHLPVIRRPEREQAVPAAARPRRASVPRRPAVIERPRDTCPNCFVEIPPAGVCGMCGYAPSPFE